MCAPLASLKGQGGQKLWDVLVPFNGRGGIRSFLYRGRNGVTVGWLPTRGVLCHLPFYFLHCKITIWCIDLYFSISLFIYIFIL